MKETMENTGTRRVIIGAPAKSKGGDRSVIRFDTPADDSIDLKRRLGRKHELSEDQMKRIRSSKACTSMLDRLGVRAVKG